MTDVLAAEPVPTIHELMARVLADLPAIGKNSFNKQQGFAFRGIDDVLNALNPLLAKHGVFYLPDVVERTSEERPTKSGGVLYTVHLHVRYRFYGPAGDYVEASGWGEGTDSGDKATNKAMTGAMKYVLFQTFAISTEEASESDGDHHVPEATVARGQSHSCPRCRDIFPARDDVREHLIEMHGYVRTSDGKVAPPPAVPPAAPAADGKEAATRTEEEPPNGRSEAMTSGGGAADNGPPPPADPATRPQITRIMARFGNTDRAVRLTRIGEIVGRTVTSSNELTKAEAKAVIDAMGDE